jgi:hypothetical protein
VKLLYSLPEYVLNAGGGIITFYRHFPPLLARQGHEVRVTVGSGVHAAESPSSVVIDGVRVESLSLHFSGLWPESTHFGPRAFASTGSDCSSLGSGPAVQ